MFYIKLTLKNEKSTMVDLELNSTSKQVCLSESATIEIKKKFTEILELAGSQLIQEQEDKQDEG